MKRILSLVCATATIHAAEMSVYAPSTVQSILRNHHGFAIQDDFGIKQVKDHFVDKQLLNSSAATLKKMQECGYMKVSALSDGEYKLDYCARGRGGGPLSAGIAYWVVKIGLYSAITGAAVGSVALTAGAAGGAIATGVVGGTAATAAASSATAAAGLATCGVGGLAAAGAGAGVVGVATGASLTIAAGVSASAAATEVVALGTMAAATAGAGTSVGAVGAVIGTVEAASTGAALLFLSIPFLP